MKGTVLMAKRRWCASVIIRGQVTECRDGPRVPGEAQVGSYSLQVQTGVTNVAPPTEVETKLHLFPSRRSLLLTAPGDLVGHPDAPSRPPCRAGRATQGLLRERASPPPHTVPLATLASSCLRGTRRQRIPRRCDYRWRWGRDRKLSCARRRKLTLAFPFL